MRAKLLTLAILSAVGTIFFIIGCIGFSGRHVTYYDNKFHNEWDDSTMETITSAGFALWFLLFVVQFIVGIIVLATNSKHELQNNSMRVASGIIGILGGLLFVNVIIAGIAFASEPKAYKELRNPHGNLSVDVIDKLATQEVTELKDQIQKLKQDNEALLAKQETKKKD